MQPVRSNINLDEDKLSQFGVMLIRHRYNERGGDQQLMNIHVLNFLHISFLTIRPVCIPPNNVLLRSSLENIRFCIIIIQWVKAERGCLYTAASRA